MKGLVRQVISWIAMALTFLFLPIENWPFWFQQREEELYAEMRMTHAGKSVAVAKNLLSRSVSWEEEEISTHWSASVNGGPVVVQEGREEVLPGSYSVIEYNHDGPEQAPLRSIDAEAYFNPRRVSVYVPAEVDKWAILVICLLGAVAWLSCVVYGYLISSGVLKPNRE